MKFVLRFIVIVLVVSLCGCSRISKEHRTEEVKDVIHGVWVSVFDMPLPVENKEKFTDDIEKMFSDIESKRFDNVFVQIRPYCDALYRSEIFPFSKCLTGVQGKDPGFDPMEIMIKSAHNHNLKFHAWLNPYRILSESDPSKLCDSNPALKFIAKGDGSVYMSENGIYFNPASVPVQKLILDGVREIVENYDVDGIHIDDYFYPSTDSEIDKNEYEKYNGGLSLSDWRKMNINSFVSGMYSAVKSIKSTVIVSVSPSGNLESNYSSHFADVKKWLSTDGFADLIIPQIYFGFENEDTPFEKTLDEWKSLQKSENVSLAIGLALYKGSQEDLFAGKGKDEWIKHSDIIKRQIDCLNDLGFVLYSYSYTSNKEWENYFNE